MHHEDELKSQGVVTSRRCPLCGHHEIGVTTGDGEFRPLLPGMLVKIIGGGTEARRAPQAGAGSSPEQPHSQERKGPPSRRLWVPAEARWNRELCLKYVVWVDEETSARGMSPQAYREAYLSKLQTLIEKESDVPLPVVLDRLFTAPYLASGTAKEIAEALWRELEEVRRPANLMEGYIESKGSQESIERAFAKRAQDHSSLRPLTDKEIEAELERLGLEEFLEILVG